MFGDSVLGFGLAFTLQDRFSNVARGIQANLASFSSNAENFTNRVNTAIGGMQTGFATLAGGAAVLAPLGFAVSKAMDFEAQLSSIKAVTGASQTMLDQYKDLALEAGAATKYSALEAAQGIEELAKAGVATEKIMGGGLQAALNLATAGEISVKQASEMAATALAVFNKEGLTLEKVANVMSGSVNASKISMQDLKYSFSEAALTASGLGYSFEDTTALMGLFGQKGLESSKAGTEFKNMFGGLIPKTKEAKKAMAELGLVTSSGVNVFTTSEGKFKSFGEIANIMSKTFGKMTETERFEKLKTIFGEVGKDAANVFVELDANKFAQFKQEMSKVTAADVAKERLNNLKGSIEQLTGSFETAMIVVGGTFTPTLRVLTDVVGSLVNGFAAFASTGVGQTLLTVVGAIGASVAVTGAAMIAMNGYRIAVATIDPIMNILAIRMNVMMGVMSSFNARVSMMTNSIMSLPSTLGKTYATMQNGLIGLQLQSSIVFGFLQNRVTGYFAAVKNSMTGLLATFNNMPSVLAALRLNTSIAFVALRNRMFMFYQSTTMAISGTIQSIRAGLIPALTSLSRFLIRGALFSGMGIALIGLAYAGYKAYEAFQSFDKIISGEKRADTGLLGFFQKTFILGQAVVEMFQNVDKEGVAMSANLHNALKSLGLENAALGLGAIVYNLYGLWTGMANGFATILPYWDRLFVAIGAIGNSIGQLLLPLFKVFGLVGENATQFDALAMVGEKIVTFLLAPFKLLVFALEQFSNLLGGTVNFMQDVGILEREKPQQQQMPYMPMVLNESVAKEKAAQFQANQQIYNIANNTNTMATNATNPATTPINVTVVTEVDGQKLNATLKNIEQLNENRQ